MVYIETNQDNIVTFIHYFPHELTEERKRNGFLVDGIPIKPVEQIGKKIILKYAPNSNAVYYEYIDRPLTTEEELQQLKQRQELMQQALDELLLNGGL